MAHFLLVYDYAQERLLVKERFEDHSEALRAQFALERQYWDNPRVDVVVLTAESEEALKRTHSTYFYDLPGLIARLRDTVEASHRRWQARTL